MARTEQNIIIRADDKTAAAFRKVMSNMNKLEQQGRTVQRSLHGVGAAIVGVATGLAARATAQTIIEFERLQASLTTVTGSAENAQVAFDALKDFTARTPFQLQEVVGAFIKLKALGLQPTEESLESFGNTASAMGKSLDQFVEAVADAVTGEFERLKEFGIKARSEGDRVRFTFQGTTTEIGKNAREIEEYLRGIGNVQFAGAMERQMETLGGAVSNMQDSISLLMGALGEAGLSKALKNASNFVRDLADDMRDLTDAAGDQGLLQAFRNLFGVLVFGTGSPEEQLGKLEYHMDELLERERELLKIKHESGGTLIPEQFAELGRIREDMKETEAAIKQLQPAVFGVFNTAKEAGGGKGLGDLIVDGTGGDAASGDGGGEKKLSDTQKKIQSIIGTLQQQADTVGMTNAQIQAYELSLLGADEATIRLAEDLANSIDQWEAYQETIRNVEAANREARQEQERLQQSMMDEGQRVFEATRTEAEQYRMELERLEELLQSGAIDAITYGRAVEDAKDKMKDAEEQGAKTKEMARDLGLTFTSAFEDAVIEGKNLSDVLKGLFDDIQRLLLRRTVTEPVTDLFDSILGSVFGGGGSAGGGGSPGSSGIVAGEWDWMKNIGNFLGDLWPFAHGGEFQVGGAGGTDSQLVAFKASPNETVTVRTPQQMTDSRSIVIHNNIDARGSEISEARFQRALKESEDRTIRRIRDMQLRNRF